MALLIQHLMVHWPMLVWVLVTSSMVAIFETLMLVIIAPLLSNEQTNLPSSLPGFLLNIFNLMVSLPFEQQLLWIASSLLVCTLVKNCFVWFNIVAASNLRALVVKEFRMNIINRLMNVNIGFINRKRLSDIQQVVELHCDNAVGMIIDSVVTVMPYLLTMVVLVTFLFKLSVVMTVCAVLLAIVASVLLVFFSRIVRHFGAIQVQERNYFSRFLLDILHGMKVIRIFGKEQEMISVFDKRCDTNHASFKYMMRASGMVGPIFEVCGIIILCVILYLAATQVGSHMITRDVLLVFILIWIRIIPPVKALNQTKAAITARLPALKEINIFLKETASAQKVQSGNLFKSLKHGITFNNVGFRYDVDRPLVFDGLNFEIRKGSFVGIVGSSGAGKSTIAELLLRFYEPTHGAILVDGVDLKTYDYQTWRRSIGVVSQDVFLFHDTIRANIAFGNTSVGDEQIINVAKKAYAHDFIMQLPKQYDTRIGERGVLLSGGQRQRLAIARAILNDPSILLFDEATSSLDSESERYIQLSLDNLAKSKTVIVIAHRLSTIMKADHLIVLEAGQIVEQGAPMLLLAKNGYFKKLIEIQGYHAGSNNVT